MSSVSSLVTTAASDESSSADSSLSYPRNDHIQRSKPSQFRHRRSTSTLKLARSTRVKNKIAKQSQQQKVMCRCRICEGKRMVSKSTCYRHLRIEAEIAEDDAKWEARWSCGSTPLWLFKPVYYLLDEN